MKHFLKFLTLVAVATACGGEERGVPDFGSEYFPVEVGMYRIYDVEEVHYAAATPEVLRYSLMMEITHSFPSGGDQYTYVVHRSTREEGNAQWDPLDTWSVRKDNRQVVVAEGNVPFVKLNFPVEEQIRWDGNVYNTLGEDEYILRDVGEPFAVEGMTFEQTATVEQENNPDAIVFRDQRKEVYARGIGLVYREVVQLHYCTDDACLGQQQVDDGLEMKVSIKEYGKH